MMWQRVADYQQMSEMGAARIFDVIANAAQARTRINLGLATGNTMIELYRLLAGKLNRNRIRLDHLHSYHLDEYVGADSHAVSETHPLSYRRYMQKNLFSRFDASLGFQSKQVHFPDPDDPARFDSGLVAAGGLDFQLLGLGFNGHIAFNEPEAATEVSRETFAARPSRIVQLTALTLETNARLTAGGELGRMPQRAVTMGMKPILAARQILLLACFREQQTPLQRMLSMQPTPELPASYLSTHPDATLVYTADTISLA